MYVHHLQTLEEEGRFVDVGALEVGALAFSRGGEWLVSASKEPHPKLCIFDLSDVR